VAEYIALGMVLGPIVVPEVHPFFDLTAVAPVFAFAAGWVGLLYGLELDFSAPGLSRPIRIAFVDWLVTSVLVTAAALWFFRSGMWMAPVPWSVAWPCAVVLGAAASAGSSSAVDLLRERYHDAVTHLLPLLRRTTRLSNALAISTFGLVLCIWRVSEGSLDVPERGVLVTIGIGVTLGLLFFLFIGKDQSANKAFMSMVGILVFASGAAFFLQLSALAVNLILGMTLAQTRRGGRMAAQLERTQRPVTLTLLLFAGALWNPPPIAAAVVLALGFVALRLVAKILGVGLATGGTPLRGDLWRGLLDQGDVAVAMAIGFQIVYEHPAVDLVHTTILVAVMFHALTSPRMLQGLLVDAGEVTTDPAMAGR
ncbi:MAG: hypothetical protein AAF211_20585, partial [Myxococcota bacterium]